MGKILTISVLLATTLLASGGAKSWSYGGSEGPEFWGDLADNYSMCKDGKNQSPVNLTDFTDTKMEPLTLNYKAFGTNFINNGHTVQVNFTKGSNLTVDGKEFELKQFHFHTPSENHIDGKSYPMEAHLVHASKDGALAVVSVMINEGKSSNPFFNTLVSKIPKKAKQSNDIKDAKLNAHDMLPEDKDYYRFSGSLTTPPCSEGVRWLVLKTPVEASKEELEAFSTVMGDNNRPIQPIHAREVLE